MLHVEHRPRATAEQKTTDIIDQPVNKFLVEIPERAAIGRLHRVALGAGKDGIEFHKIAPAKEPLSFGA